MNTPTTALQDALSYAAAKLIRAKKFQGENEETAILLAIQARAEMRIVARIARQLDIAGIVTAAELAAA